MKNNFDCFLLRHCVLCEHWAEVFACVRRSQWWLTVLPTGANETATEASRGGFIQWTPGVTISISDPCQCRGRHKWRTFRNKRLWCMLSLWSSDW